MFLLFTTCHRDPFAISYIWSIVIRCFYTDHARHSNQCHLEWWDGLYYILFLLIPNSRLCAYFVCITPPHRALSNWKRRRRAGWENHVGRAYNQYLDDFPLHGFRRSQNQSSNQKSIAIFTLYKFSQFTQFTIPILFDRWYQEHMFTNKCHHRNTTKFLF